MQDTRSYYYGKIHESARALELPDPAYRNVLYALTGKRSCTELNESELFRVNLFMGGEVARLHVRAHVAPKYAADDFSDEACLELLG